MANANGIDHNPLEEPVILVTLAGHSEIIKIPNGEEYKPAVNEVGAISGHPADVLGEGKPPSHNEDDLIPALHIEPKTLDIILTTSPVDNGGVKSLDLH